MSFKKIATICGIFMLIAVITIIALIGFGSNTIHYELNNQWGLRNTGQPIEGINGIPGVDINVDKAWKLTKGSPEVIIGVVDTGIETTNIEIKGSIFMSNDVVDRVDNDNNGFIDDISGWNFYDNSNVIYDNYLHDNHGTFLASIICGSHDAGKIYGIAPNIKILPLKFMSGSRGQTSDAIKAIDYAASKGVKIINCSWDSPIYDKDLYDTIKRHSDILFVCSAGKSGKDLADEPIYPACYDLPNIISVAAMDNKGELYIFSGYGEDVDIAAPGVNIYSSLPDGDYMYSSGTSLATAYVTGTAALIMSLNMEITPEFIKEVILESSTKIDSLANKIKSGGYVNAYESLLLLK